MIQKDERGFTLVELLISIGMFSIIMIAIIMFITTGTRSYNYTKSELNLQKESQMLIAQIRDLAYNANYTYFDTSKDALFLEKVVYKPSATNSSDPLATPIPAKQEVEERNVVYMKDGKLYVEECSKTGSVMSAPTYGADEDDLLSDYVTSFDAKIKKADIQLTIKMKNRKTKEYKINEGITLRSGFTTPTP